MVRRQRLLYTRMVRSFIQPRLNASLAWSACDRAPMGAEKGDLDDRIAAIVTAPSKHLKIQPSSMTFPRNTSNGSFASCRPNGVNSSEAVSALTSTRASIARRMFFAKGGWSASANVCSMAPSLQILTRSTRSCNDRRNISAVWSGAN